MQDYFNEYIFNLAKNLLALVLFTAAYSKLANVREFRKTLMSLRLGYFIEPVIVMVPTLEALLAICFALDVQTPLAGVIAIALFSSFFLVASLTLLSKKEIRCSCFGQGNSKLGLNTMLQNLVLIMLSFQVLDNMSVNANMLLMLHSWFMAGMVFLIFRGSTLLWTGWLNTVER